MYLKHLCLNDQLALFQAQVGDVLIGLPSSGVHSNGFSLVRRVLANLGVSLQDPAPWDSATTMGMLQLIKFIIEQELASALLS